MNDNKNERYFIKLQKYRRGRNNKSKRKIISRKKLSFIQLFFNFSIIMIGYLNSIRT